MLRIEVDREDDGRWLAEITELPGVIAYGSTESEAKLKTIALAFRVIGERLAHDEPVPINIRDYFIGV